MKRFPSSDTLCGVGCVVNKDIGIGADSGTAIYPKKTTVVIDQAVVSHAYQSSGSNAAKVGTKGGLRLELSTYKDEGRLDQKVEVHLDEKAAWSLYCDLREMYAEHSLSECTGSDPGDDPDYAGY